MTPDMTPTDVLRLAASLPKFPDGRIDYTHAKEAAVLNCAVHCNGKILLLKRSDKVGWLKNRWHTIAGFLDDDKPLGVKALEELYEETGINASVVKSIRCAAPFTDTDEDKTWHIYPVEIELLYEPTIVLDWENTEHAWIDFADIDTYEVIASVKKIVVLLGNS